MSTIVFPGQGAQHKGMGENLFDEFADLIDIADQILGYSIRELCLEDADNRLNLTQFTQPALYTVNALHYLKYLKKQPKPEILAGHSLGEYNALFAAGVFDFQTGLKLVQKRGELMSQVKNGGMLAVVKTTEEQVEQILSIHQSLNIDIANYNSPSQFVLSGDANDVAKAKKIFDQEQVFCIPLKVSGAFHSRHMQPSSVAFAEFLKDFHFSSIKIPVVANITGLPHRDDQVKQLLTDQLCGSVQWTKSIRYLMGINQQVVTEVGPGQVLTKLVDEIMANCDPLFKDINECNPDEEISYISSDSNIDSISLGSQTFLTDYGVKYPYIAGSMSHGISSDQLVIKMAKSGFMAFLGSYGLSIKSIKRLIESCKKALQPNQAFGINIHFNPNELNHQKQLIELCLLQQVNYIELSGFDHISLDLIKYRAKGLTKKSNQVIKNNKILLKTSKSDTAELFMQTAPKHLLDKLLADQQITAEEYDLAQQITVVDDICVEGDSGWKTEQANTLVILPEIIQLRNKLGDSSNQYVRVGSSGGLGTPAAIAAVFMLGADFVLTGSINQCTVEANISDEIKQLLTKLSSDDTCYVPSGDMFESGGLAQVVRKGLYYPARAQKLYDLYRVNNSIADLNLKDKQQIEQHFMHTSFENILEELFASESSEEINKIKSNEKYKMAKVFKWYFTYAKNLVMSDQQQDHDNYQIHAGPALGAFNQWVLGSEIESWQNRHVDDIALRLLTAAESFKLKAQVA